jgi:hypothetical protein
MKCTRHILVLGYLILLLTACTPRSLQTHSTVSTKALSTPTPTATPPQPSVPNGTVLYQSDWSRGLAGWGGSPGWKIVGGMPQSDLSQNNALTLPYQLTIPNYAIEFRFQIVSVPQNGGFFIVKANRTQDKDGYTAGILGLLSPAPHSEFANPEILIYLDPMDSTTSTRPSDYEPRDLWHTFRVEVQGPEANFFADGFSKGRATSSQTNWLSNGPLQLICSEAIVRVSSVRLIAL